MTNHLKKSLLQFTVLIVLFFSLWQSFSFVDWMSIFNVKKNVETTEEKLGNLYWDYLSKISETTENPKIITPIDSLFHAICTKNNIDSETIKLHVIITSDVNAYALPNGHLVVNTGLLQACNNEAELCGVLCHEIAHIQKKHIMNKLIKELGLSALISITTGRNGETIKQTLKMLTSTAYDRQLETEADLTAVEYLINTQIDPTKFADFLYHLGESSPNVPSQLYWISTHPQSKERAEAIIEAAKHKQFTVRTIITDQQWTDLQNACSSK